jgi:hypothetical protein
MKPKFIKNLSRGFIISMLTLSSLSATLYHDDAFAGGNGGGNAGGSSAGNGHGNQGANASNAKAGTTSNTANGRATTNSVAVQADIAQIQVEFTRETYHAWLDGILEE